MWTNFVLLCALQLQCTASQNGIYLLDKFDMPQSKQTKKSKPFTNSYTKHVDMPQVCLAISSMQAEGNTVQRDEGNRALSCALQLPCTAQQNGVVLVLSSPCLFFWLLSCERLSATRCILKFFVWQFSHLDKKARLIRIAIKKPYWLLLLKSFTTS